MSFTKKKKIYLLCQKKKCEKKSSRWSSRFKMPKSETALERLLFPFQKDKRECSLSLSRPLKLEN